MDQETASLLELARESPSRFLVQARATQADESARVETAGDFHPLPGSPRFRPGDLVCVAGGSVEMLVERYDLAGAVLCSFWEGVSRPMAAYGEAELVKIPMPIWDD